MKKRITAALLCLLACLPLLTGCGTTGARIFSPYDAGTLRDPDFVDFTVSRYYYRELTRPQQQAYQQIYNSVFSFPDKIQVPRLTEDELSEVILAVKYDNPFLIFLDSAYTYSTGSNRCYVFPDYHETAKTARENVQALLRRAREIAAAAAAQADPFAAELLIHDAICEGCRYESGPDDDNAYGALVVGRAVCEGYALAAKLLLDMIGVPACAVRGKAAEPGETPVTHMWNAVRLDSGWYFLDCTWDDPVLAEGGACVRHAYFNTDAETLNRTHGGYVLPAEIVCDKTQDQYFRRMGLYCTSHTWEDVVRRTMASAERPREAEFCFESEALLTLAAERLFDEGALFDMLPADTGRCRWAAQADARTLQIRFAGEAANE